MTASSRDVIVETLDWRGLLIEVRYEPEWLGCTFTASRTGDAGALAGGAAGHGDRIPLALHGPADDQE